MTDADKIRLALDEYQSWRSKKEQERAKEDAEWLWTRLHEALRQ